MTAKPRNKAASVAWPQHDGLSIHIPLVARSVPSAPRGSTERPLAAAEILVLAHEMHRLIEEGVVTDRQHMAMVAGFSNTRISQIMILLELAPDIQEEILFMSNGGGYDRITAKSLLPIARLLSWKEQRARWRELVAQSAGS